MSMQTIERNESIIKKPRRGILNSFGVGDYEEFQSQGGLEKFRLFTFHENERFKEFHQNTLMNNKHMMALGLLVACICYTGLLAISVIYYCLKQISYVFLISQLLTVGLL